MDLKNLFKGKKKPEDMSAVEALQRAIELEINGLQFYQMAAKQSESPKVKELFEEFAKEEITHRHVLEQTFAQLIETGQWKSPQMPKPDKYKFHDSILNREFKESMKKGLFEATALSIGVMLEQRAAQFYHAAHKKAKDPNAKKLFKWLSDWESGHLDKMISLEQNVRKEYWAEANFYPMI
jgi:rubrerythrin